MASTTKDQPENPEISISDSFDQAFDLYNAINNTSEATNSEKVQSDVKKAIKMLENCTRMVSGASIFSTNESIEELSPNDIKFLLLPVLLGMLHLKICGNDRKELIDMAEIYFKDYLKRCHEYGLTELDVSKKKENESTSEREETEVEIIQRIVNSRTNKIKRYQEQKALDERIAYLKLNLDDDVKREFYTTLLKSYIYQVVDELKSIEMERPMLEIHQRNRNNRVPRTNIPKPAPLKPIIITKDEIQKAVFGAGYPSLPTMTVKEFYDKRVADGIFPDPNKPKTGPMSLQEMAVAGITPDEEVEEKDTEEKIENDDEEMLARLRNRDEMRDEFRRGYGNRMNRS